MIQRKNLPDMLRAWQFVETASGVYQRKFAQGEVSVNLTEEHIDYLGIRKVWRETTLNFSQQENFVVLDCVCRLLQVGYAAGQIELEAGTPGGHADEKAGYADIVVFDNAGDEYLIIECKTPASEDGDEFQKEWDNTRRNGGQLFNYFNTYRKARYLVLYTTDLVASGEVLPLYHVITLSDNQSYLDSNPKLASYRSVRQATGSRDDYFRVWTETYQQDYSKNGVFEADAEPFHIGRKKLRAADLVEIDAASMQKKYNEYATILRKYNVSSKENAFDKLINLFLAKIIDEKYNASELKCYWRGAAYDNYYDLHDRLHTLYKRGMEEFFDDKITYVENEQVDRAFRFLTSKADAARDTIRKYFRELKYFNNNPFAILDVHNEELFNQNAVILREVVRMIQDIRLSSTHQNQFLGDLFEGFLDQGIKQSEGQFFTPLPIVRFLVSSLPLASLAAREKGEPLPRVIDYACGAGHFLTEFASELRPLVEERGDSPRDYYAQILGIEKEYRLSKVAQVSVYMYGQDGIRIRYQDALRQRIPGVESGTFSVLVANPPYSVKGFFETLPAEDRQAYQLAAYVTNPAKNNAIETFFVERAAQLLQPGGLAAIILPSSILSKGGIYAACREILLASFHLVAIACFGSATFGKTGTNTVTLFLRRRGGEPEDAAQYRNRVAAWLGGNFADDTAYGDGEALAAYAARLGVPVGDYRAFLAGGEPPAGDYFAAAQAAFSDTKRNAGSLPEAAKEIRQRFKTRQKGKTYRALPEEAQQAEARAACRAFLLAIEREKLYLYLLVRSNQRPVVIVNAPTGNREQKAFLGYEWSTTKGNEGIKYLNAQKTKTAADGEDEDDTLEKITSVDGIKTPLFDPHDLASKTKINTIIRENFLGRPLEIPENLREYVSVLPLERMIDFQAIEFEQVIQTTGVLENEPFFIASNKYSTDNLDNLCLLNPPKSEIAKLSDDTMVSFVEMADLSDEGFIKHKVNRPLGEVRTGSYKYFRDGDFILAKITPCMENGKCALAENLTNGIGFGSSEYHVFRCKERILPQYLYCLLNREEVRKEAARHMTGTSGHRRVPIEFYARLMIPVPPMEIQKEIISANQQLEKKISVSKEEIAACDENIQQKFVEMFGNPKRNEKNWSTDLLRNISIGGLRYGSGASAVAYDGRVRYIRITDICEDGTLTEEKVSPSSMDEKYLLHTGDLLFARSGNTVGKTFLYRNTEEQAIYAGYLIRCIPDKKRVVPEFLYSLTRTNYYRSFVEATTKGTRMSAQPNINANQYGKFEVMLPPIELQNEYADYVKSMHEKATQARERKQQAEQEKQQLLTKYFQSA